MRDIILPHGKNKWDLMKPFCENLIEFRERAGFKISSRGWGYQLEGWGLITKDQLDKVERIINDARKEGYLPVDFVPEEDGRNFHGVDVPSVYSISDHVKNEIEWLQDCGEFYTPNFWEGEEYYLQMLVEKVDLRTLFSPICEKYHIPIANSKGWSSILQRATYARRFREAEDNGLKCVLLYCGDHDPDGLRISDTIRKNLSDVQDITWEDGTGGYDPENLIIDRFGLNKHFILKENLTWIDGLITGNGKNLASPSHPNNQMEYVQDYILAHGPRKCEANAIVTRPDAARDLVKNAIEYYLGHNAEKRFGNKTEKVKIECKHILREYGYDEFLARSQMD